jgi:hypothetical protein
VRDSEDGAAVAHNPAVGGVAEGNGAEHRPPFCVFQVAPPPGTTMAPARAGTDISDLLIDKRMLR